jgi:predicted acetyltransferase
MSDRYPIRPIAEDEFGALLKLANAAFNHPPPSEEQVRHDAMTFEFERSLGAFDGPAIVGSAAAYSFRLSVPGAVIPAAGVTAVAVAPTHRRRGILSSLMRRQFADIAGRGEAVAILFASETPIYPRYGYGMASADLRFRIRRGEAALAPHAVQMLAASGLEIRSAEPAEAIADLAKVYDVAQPRRPGMPARDQRWWDATVHDPEHHREGKGPLQCVIAADPGGPRGYALFSAGPGWDEFGIPGGTLEVRELVAADPVASLALWREMLTRDLIAEVTARMRPADDPLPFLLADGRRVRRLSSDGLWARLVSVPGALAERRYARPMDVVIEVADELLPGNAGRWRLQAAESGRASCERSTAAADLALPASALGAAYLGGTRLGALADAGLVTELRDGALASLSTAMAWDPAPWCPFMF